MPVPTAMGQVRPLLTGRGEDRAGFMSAAATANKLPTAPNKPSGSAKGVAGGRVDRCTADGTAPPSLVKASLVSRAPSRSTIAGRPTASSSGSAMLAIGADWTNVRTQRWPQATRPGTSAPCHTPRTPPPGSPTGLHRKDGPGGHHTHADDCENGDDSATRALVSAVILVVCMVTMWDSANVRREGVARGADVRVSKNGDLRGPPLPPSPHHASSPPLPPAAILHPISRDPELPVIPPPPAPAPCTAGAVCVSAKLEQVRRPDTHTALLLLGRFRLIDSRRREAAVSA